jgi:hypothetical protein
MEPSLAPGEKEEKAEICKGVLKRIFRVLGHPFS